MVNRETSKYYFGKGKGSSFNLPSFGEVRLDQEGLNVLRVYGLT